MCRAQLPQCYVSTLTGSACVIRKAKKVDIKRGDYIYKTDSIIVSPDAEVTMIDYSNKVISVNKPGRYTCGDLQKTFTTKSTGITEAYFKFIWEDLFKPEEHQSISPRNIGGATGGAIRGASCNLMTEPLNNAKLDADTVCFTWHPVVHSGLYRFTLQDKAKGDIINILTKDTVLYLFRKDLLQAETTSYYWKVTEGNKVCTLPPGYFTITSSNEKNKQVGAIINTVTKDDDELVYNLSISDKLAQNGWNKEAFDYYIKAKNTLVATHAHK